MPQDSQWAAQATVLRQALAEQGLELAPPQALKVLSQMRGHPTWQALGEAPRDVPAARPAPPPGAAPAGSRVFVFEACGMAAAGALPGGGAFGSGDWEAVRRQAAVLGFSSLEQLAVRVRPAPATEASQSVVVMVRLAGSNGLSQLGAVPANLAALLEQLALPACRCAEGIDRVTRYAWKLVAIEEPGAG